MRVLGVVVLMLALTSSDRVLNGAARQAPKAGMHVRYIEGLPIDFTKRAQQLLDVVPDKDFARTRTIFFLYRVPPREAGDITREEDAPVHYPQIEMVGPGQLSADERG